MTLDPSATDFDPSLFPTAFRQERIRRGVSLDDLARRTGLRLSVLWEIERGEIPADEHLARMLLGRAAGQCRGKSRVMRDRERVRVSVALKLSAGSNVSDLEITEEMITAAMAKADARVCVGSDRCFAFPESVRRMPGSAAPQKGRCRSAGSSVGAGARASTSGSR